MTDFPLEHVTFLAYAQRQKGGSWHDMIVTSAERRALFEKMAAAKTWPDPSYGLIGIVEPYGFNAYQIVQPTEVDRSPVVPEGAVLAPDEEAVVQALEERLYKECYRGHIPPEQWRRLAEFCYHYGQRLVRLVREVEGERRAEEEAGEDL